MAVPIIPILKKVGAAVLSNKKGRKTVLYIILTVTIIVTLPIMIAVMGIFSNDVSIDTSEIDGIMQEREKIEAERHAEIERVMTDAEYSEIKIREAQAVYSFALFNLCQPRENNTNYEANSRFVLFFTQEYFGVIVRRIPRF